MERNQGHVHETVGKKGGRMWAVVLLVVVLAALAVAARALPVKDYLRVFLSWTETVGMWGPVVLVGVYILACVLMAPGSLVTLGAGFLFKVVVGTVAVSVGSTLGACAAFLLGRTLARKWVSEKVAGNARFGAIDEAVGREGFKIVLLTRLSPIFPFNLLNYAYGVTRVSFRNYALASWIGMLPGTVMYVYIGSTFRSIADLGAGGREKSLGEWVFFAVGLAITVVVVGYVTRVARRVLGETSRTASGREGLGGEAPEDEQRRG